MIDSFMGLMATVLPLADEPLSNAYDHDVEHRRAKQRKKDADRLEKEADLIVVQAFSVSGLKHLAGNNPLVIERALTFASNCLSHPQLRDMILRTEISQGEAPPENAPPLRMLQVSFARPTGEMQTASDLPEIHETLIEAPYDFAVEFAERTIRYVGYGHEKTLEALVSPHRGTVTVYREPPPCQPARMKPMGHASDTSMPADDPVRSSPDVAVEPTRTPDESAAIATAGLSADEAGLTNALENLRKRLAKPIDLDGVPDPRSSPAPTTATSSAGSTAIDPAEEAASGRPASRRDLPGTPVRTESDGIPPGSSALPCPTPPRAVASSFGSSLHDVADDARVEHAAIWSSADNTVPAISLVRPSQSPDAEAAPARTHAEPSGPSLGHLPREIFKTGRSIRPMSVTAFQNVTPASYAGTGAFQYSNRIAAVCCQSRRRSDRPGYMANARCCEILASPLARCSPYLNRLLEFQPRRAHVDDAVADDCMAGRAQ